LPDHSGSEDRHPLQAVFIQKRGLKQGLKHPSGSGFNLPDF
jgi:hypothetical protein